MHLIQPIFIDGNYYCCQAGLGRTEYLLFFTSTELIDGTVSLINNGEGEVAFGVCCGESVTISMTFYTPNDGADDPWGFNYAISLNEEIIYGVNELTFYNGETRTYVINLPQDRPCGNIINVYCDSNDPDSTIIVDTTVN